MTAAAWILCLAVAAPPAGPGPVILVGSKTFTESVILGEIVTQLARAAGARAEHQREFGGTRLLFGALERGEIDAYPEYTGTIIEEILAGDRIETGEQLEAALEARGIRITAPLGFNNTYAIGVTPETADRLGLSKVSDLRDHPDLLFGFSNEFMQRGDGWPALRDRYRLPQTRVNGLEHALALRALAEGSIDVTDLYSTDADIAHYGFRVLDDDLGHFPRYDAVVLYRADLERRAPAAVEAIRGLGGAISEDAMIEMNRRVQIGHEREPAVAASFLDVVAPAEETFVARQLRLLGEHLHMVAVSMALAILVSVPLGVAAAYRPRAGHVILAVVGIIQTVPALALLVLLIPVPWPREAGRPDVLGVGTATAIAALFLYSLLPIVRNTQAGLAGIDPSIRETAEALGLSVRARLLTIEVPLASRTILAGIKTAAVINIGFATLGAFISAGGYGQPILTGLRLDRYDLILEGAVPAAMLAVATQLLFELAERAVVPKGLRLRSAS